MYKKHNISAILLAGGKSSRMGTEKGLVLHNNKPFIAHIINAVQSLVREIIIVSGNSDYDKFNLKRVEDIIEDAGPLGGLYSGLYHSKTEINLVLSCDIPLINTQTLATLINEITADEDIIQVTVNGKSNPLLAIYKKQCLKACLETLKLGERRLQTFVKQQKTKTITLDVSLEKYAMNINTPHELKSLNDDIEH